MSSTKEAQVSLEDLIKQAEKHIQVLHYPSSSSSSTHLKKKKKSNVSKEYRLHKINTSTYHSEESTSNSTSSLSTSLFTKSNESASSISALDGLSEVPSTLPVVVPSTQTTDTIIETAGAKWFDLPATPMTQEIKQDLTLIRSREILDPKRHYKRDKKNSGLPKYFQMGTVIAPPHEFYSSRLTRQQRKATITEEILADKTMVNRIKRKAVEIQHEKAKKARPRGLTKKLYANRKKKASHSKQMKLRKS